MKQAAPETTPTQMAPIAPMEPEAGVTPTRPAMAPETMPRLEGRP